MRFITEFENDGTKFDAAMTDYRKECQQSELGKLIADSFGWTERGITSLRPSDPIKDKFSLEIEAFPMDKWFQFKTKLLEHFCIYPGSTQKMLDFIKELESFGKPDIIINELEYRSPDSHCKACEDEAAGIKHIKAQKHTCKK